MTASTEVMRILVYGKDARTHAIAEALRRSGVAIELAVYSDLRIPGLVRTADVFKQGKMTAEELDAMMEFAREFGPDLVIIGPEDPLGFGLVDRLQGDLGVPCFGPTQSLARIETSKSWTRLLMEKYQVPGNVIARSFTSSAGLVEFAQGLGDIVVKPDGLTGGKGVKVMGDHLDTVDDAVAYAEELIRHGGTVVIEERLEGEEFSLQSITDGTTVIHCPPVQDHKRAGLDDTGPNTGGMGSYSAANGTLPFLETSDLEEAQRINETVIRVLQEETGEPYRGVLYGGFMATRDGIRVIEYNARFGDPEAMNVLALFEGNFVEVAHAVATGTLDRVSVSFAKKATVCKYVVPEGYPDRAVSGEIVSVDEDALDDSQVRCYWAATNLNAEDKVELTGSRAMAFVGIADTLAEAEALAEAAASSVGGRVRWRSDIGTAELIQKRVDHMQALRRP
jgi:phosphoribosylamine--glycine ligase